MADTSTLSAYLRNAPKERPPEAKEAAPEYCAHCGAPMGTQETAAAGEGDVDPASDTEPPKPEVTEQKKGALLALAIQKGK